MKLYSLMLVVWAALAQVTFAYEPDVTQQRIESAYVGPLDHLIPVGSTFPVQAPRYYLAKFGIHPSFSPAFEWCVLLQEKRYVLRSWRLERSKGEDVPRQVDTLETEIPKEMAAVLYTLWANAILDARYSRQSPGLDGTTYEFSTFLRGIGYPSARTWSPEEDLPPKWLASAGEDVLAYARGQNRDTNKLLALLQATNKRLSAYRGPAIATCAPGLVPSYMEPATSSLPRIAPRGTLVLGFIVEQSGAVTTPYIISSTSTWQRGDQLQMENVTKWKYPKQQQRCRHSTTFKWAWDK